MDVEEPPVEPAVDVVEPPVEPPVRSTWFGIEQVSTTDCATRDMSKVEELLTSNSLTPEMRGRVAMVETCNTNHGKAGYLEVCCSLHQYENSGYGNQILQMINAVRFARRNRCDVLCLPDCSDRTNPRCGLNLMW